jgi:hypothetical protein
LDERVIGREGNTIGRNAIIFGLKEENAVQKEKFPTNTFVRETLLRNLC